MREIKASERTGSVASNVTYGYLIESANRDWISDGTGYGTEAEAVAEAMLEVNCCTADGVQVVGYVTRIERIAKVVP